MSLIKSISIVWESSEEGGVNSYLKYLINSNLFKEKKIYIYTNNKNKGAKILEEDLKNNSNVEFKYFKSYFDNENKNTAKMIFLHILNPIFLILSIIKFYSLLSRTRSEVLFCQCGNYGAIGSEMGAIFAAKYLKIPVISMVVHHACRKPPFLSVFIMKLVDNLISKSLTSLISVSKATKNSIFYNSSLLDSGRLKDVVIYNGVPKVNFQKEDHINLKKFCEDKNILKIGMISRLDPHKGHDDLLFAFSKLPENLKNKIKIFISGADRNEYKSKLLLLCNKLLIEKSVIFLDYIKEDSQKIISSLDLLVSLTKSYEGFGLSVAEAMSVETPILATDVGAIKEVINSETGKLVTPGQILEVRDALMDFYENRKIWIERAKIAKIKAEKYFNSETMAENYIAHFEAQKIFSDFNK